MALREVLQFPDPRLKCVAEPITKVTDAVRSLAQDMTEVMYDEPGVGLAATQVGVALRLIVVDTEWGEEDNERNPIVIINPEIHDKEGSITWEESCLSVPDFNADVVRAERLTMRGHGLDGDEINIQAEGLLAVCFQHEVDHLDGILFIDRISRLKRSLYVKRRKKQLSTDARDAEVDVRGSRF